MYTFILNIPDTIKKVGEKLNAKSIICDKAWEVYNDDNVKLLYIFNPDGTMMISTNGDVKRASWQYIKANRSIVLNTMEGSYMFVPTYFDDALLILHKDGTDNYLLLLNTDERVILKTLSAINSYLKKKESELEEVQIRRKRAEQRKENREERQVLEKPHNESYSWIHDHRDKDSMPKFRIGQVVILKSDGEKVRITDIANKGREPIYFCDEDRMFSESEIEAAE